MGAFVSWNRATFAVVLADFERLTSIGALCLNCLSLSTREWELIDIQRLGCCWIKRIWNAELAKELIITLIAWGFAYGAAFTTCFAELVVRAQAAISHCIFTGSQGVGAIGGHHQGGHREDCCSCKHCSSQKLN